MPNIRYDVFSKRARSNIMRNVKSSNNSSTELKLISIFKHLKIIGWRRKYKLMGNPDFVFLKRKTAVFTDGCFWHGHNCRNLTPKDNSVYWRAKIANNKRRDKNITNALKQKGWKVIRIWECELQNKNLNKFLRKSKLYPLFTENTKHILTKIKTRKKFTKQKPF